MKIRVSNLHRKYVEEIINEIIISKVIEYRKTPEGLDSLLRLLDEKKVTSNDNKC